MEPYRTVHATAAPLDMANVSTDHIFPARYIRKPRGPGYADYTFHDLRLDDSGDARPEFVLNDPRYRDARILVADANFGCGSSREGAVYTLMDYGFQVVIAPSFGDIFASNCLKNGMVVIRLPAAVATSLRRELTQAGTPELTVDLQAQSIARPSGEIIDFEFDAFEKQCLLEGLNEIDLSLRLEGEITAFEQARREDYPWLYRPHPCGGAP